MPRAISKTLLNCKCNEPIYVDVTENCYSYTVINFRFELWTALPLPVFHLVIRIYSN